MSFLRNLFGSGPTEDRNEDKEPNETSPSDSHFHGVTKVPDPQTAALLLGATAATASDELLVDAIAGAAGMLAEAVFRAGGISRDQAMAVGILASRRASEAATPGAPGKARRAQLAQKAAMLAAMVGQGCHQHGEPGAANKAVPLVAEELSRPESAAAQKESPDGGAEKVVVGTCEACNRPLQVRRRGIRPAMRLTCKCGHSNVVHHSAKLRGIDGGV